MADAMGSPLTTRHHRCTAAILSALMLTSTSGCSLLMHSLFAQCSTLTVPTTCPRFTAFPSQTAAGVAKVDLTPPPGFPTGGDGMAGSLARGQWTRLYARAFFFEEGGRHVLLIANDLFLMSEALHTEVAARLAGDGIRADEIVLTATHTHQGPGNFSSAAVYNEFGSQYMGFSRELFDFLADRITEAGHGAIDDARTHNGEVRLALRRGPGPDVFLNRAPQVFLLNPDRDERMDEWNPNLSGDPYLCETHRLKGEPADYWQLQGCPRLRAIDRTISLLEVFRGGSRIGGLL